MKTFLSREKLQSVQVTDMRLEQKYKLNNAIE